MLILFCLLMMAGIVSPLTGSARVKWLVTSARALMVLMAYSYITSGPETVGRGGSESSRHEASFIGGCELAVALLASFSRRRKIFFWLAWALHMLLALACAAIIVWLQFFWHW